LVGINCVENYNWALTERNNGTYSITNAGITDETHSHTIEAIYV